MEEPVAWTRDKLFIGGKWTKPRSPATLVLSNPATEEPLGSVPAAAAADVDASVAAASAALEPWAATAPDARADALAAIGRALGSRTEAIAQVITAEVGTPISQSRVMQASSPVGTFFSAAQVTAQASFSEELGSSLLLRQAVGVVGAISPWNYPLQQLAAKVAFALGAGAPVVAKPSELAPLSSFLLAEAIEEAGLPPGVFNLVSGTGEVAGRALVEHPGVAMISFTGSSATGRQVAELAGANLTRLALELGGKSAALVMPDGDLQRAVKSTVTSCFLNAGQTCAALTRLLVPRSALGRAEEIAAASASNYVVGDPTAAATTMGPLISAAHRERVRRHVQVALDGGARLVCGGATAAAGLTRGYYFAPTVLSGVTPDMAIAHEEIFGPVLVIMAYDGLDEAVRIANGTPYGLGGAVWSADPDAALAVARSLQAGQVEINGAIFNPFAPFGGTKQSGMGREMGRFGLEEFLEVKSIQR